MSKQLRLDVAQLTDVGRKRPHNEDNMAYVIPKDEQVMARKGALFIVADGMGGHAAGEVASEIAVDTVTMTYYQDDSEEIALSLMNAIKRANTIIHQRAAENMLRSGMGTTCVSAVLRGHIAYVANVGDSRAYVIRHGQVRQVSQDHSWVEEQVRAGLLTRDQARSHAQRNVITRCLGTQVDVEVDVFTEELEDGDCLILCTDGLSGSVYEDDLRWIVEQYVPQESVYHLVERANENGGPDNITAIVVRVQEYLSLDQDSDGVTVLVRDRMTGHRYNIRAKYVIGADGARSQVATDIGLPFEGQMDVHGSMSIMFKAELAHLCAHRPAALYFVIQPGSNVGGVGAGVIRMVRPWNEWLINWGYDIDEEPPLIDDTAAAQIARNLIGEPDIDIEIHGVSLWGINEMWATHLQSGRVFCVGDAIHRHPPGNALGANTSVQDSHNLVWKIAAVLRGQAAPSLLETYSVERAPIAQQIVKRANQSPRDWGRFYAALGLTDATDVIDMAHQIDVRKDNTAEGLRRRAALVDAMDFKNFEFNTHGHDMGQFYESDAVISDGCALPAPSRDAELYYEQSTVPGSHLPHAWVGDHITKLATMDIAPYSQFTLITGIAGEDWEDAAAKVSAELGVVVVAVVIGAGRAVTDLYYDWAKVREVDESGALLVRPDKHVAWRSMTMPADPRAALYDALARILGRVHASGLG